MSEHSPVDTTPDDPSLDQTMRVLSDDCRREVLTHLFERDGDGPIAVEALADRITSGDTPETVTKLLYHTHLPRLDAAGIVTYERSAGRVELAGDRSSVEALLEAGRRVD
jgi:hypothetical protein